MKVMILVKASDASERGELPAPALIAAMADYHEALARAGVLLDAAGLQPSARGWRLRWRDGRREVRDGPFTETKELIAGYTLIDVPDAATALEWARRFPNPMGEGADAEIEVRPLHGLEAFDGLGADAAVARFRALGVGD